MRRISSLAAGQRLMPAAALAEAVAIAVPVRMARVRTKRAAFEPPSDNSSNDGSAARRTLEQRSRAHAERAEQSSGDTPRVRTRQASAGRSGGALRCAGRGRAGSRAPRRERRQASGRSNRYGRSRPAIATTSKASSAAIQRAGRRKRAARAARSWSAATATATAAGTAIATATAAGPATVTAITVGRRLAPRPPLRLAQLSQPLPFAVPLGRYYDPYGWLSPLLDRLQPVAELLSLELLAERSVEVSPAAGLRTVPLGALL